MRTNVVELVEELLSRLPLGVDELNSIKHGLRDEALAKLYQLEHTGLLTSKFEERDNMMVRIFYDRSTKIPPLCDILDTELCKHYQTKDTCHYKETHNVRCVINKFTGTSLGNILPRTKIGEDHE